jgi:hypothetical protein
MAYFICPEEHDKILTEKSNPKQSIISLSKVTNYIEEGIKFMNFKWNDVNAIIDMMEKFEFLFKLTEKEKEIYDTEGDFIIPSLRPFGGFSLNYKFGEKYQLIPFKFLSNNGLISPQIFFHLQYELRNHTKEIKLYCNACEIYDDGNIANIFLPRHSKSLQIVIQGSQPSLLLKKIEEAINFVNQNFTFLNFDKFIYCGGCVQELTEKISEIPEEIETKLERKLNQSRIFKCEKSNHVQVIQKVSDCIFQFQIIFLV